MADEKVGGVYYEVNADTSGLDDAQKKLDESLKKVEESLKGTGKGADDFAGKTDKLSDEVKKANGYFKAARGSIQQLGYQVQDVAVQLEMGTNPATVFAQQGSQIASLFGPGGAVIGALIAVAGAIAGPFIASLISGNAELDKFNDKIEDTIENLESTRQEILKGAIATLKGNIAETRKEIEGLEGFQPKARGITGRETQQKEATESLIEARKQLAKQTEALASLEAELNKEQIKSREDLDEMISRLDLQAEKLGKTRVELVEIQRAEALKAASTMNATQADREAINAIFDRIKAHEELQERLKAEAKAEKQRESDASERARLEGQLVGVENRLDRELAIRRQFWSDVETIQKAHNEGLVGSEEERNQLVQASHQEMLANLQEEYKNSATGIEKVWIDAVDRMDEVGASAFTDTLEQTRDLNDAVDSLARAIVKDLIKALIQYAVQWAIQQAMQIAGLSALTAAATPAATAVTVASAGGNIPPATAGMFAAQAAGQAAFGGGRATGGQVSPGNLYRIDEHGAGEFFQPSVPGKVLTQDQAGQNSGTVNIQLITENNMGGQAAVTVESANQQPDGSIIVRQAVNAVAQQFASGVGEIPKAARSGTNIVFNSGG